MNSSWNEAGNVLCVRLDAIGDVLMTSPAIRALKESLNGRSVTLLTSAAGAEVAPFIAEIDNVIVYDAPWLKTTGRRESSCPEFAMIERLRAQQFDAAVVFTVYSQNPLPSALLCYLADIPLRLAHCRENPYQLLTDWVVDPEPQQYVRHEVQRQLDLVAAAGCSTGNIRLSFRVPAYAFRRVQDMLRRLEIDLNRPWIVMHPGATAASRRYPAERFAAVAELLARRGGYPIVLTGAFDEQRLVEDVRRRCGGPVHSLAGKLDLGELGALISLASLLVSNNTGPVHIAAAVGTPVVDLYALTNPQHTPWNVPHRVLSRDVPCRYCYKSVCPEGHQRCLTLIAPEDVADAGRELLAETSAAYFRAARAS